MKNAANCVNQCELQDTLIIDVSNAHGGSGSLPEPRPVEGRLLPKREFADSSASRTVPRFFTKARPFRIQLARPRVTFGFFPAVLGFSAVDFTIVRLTGPSISRFPDESLSRFFLFFRPQLGRDDPLNLSILLRGGKENNDDSLSKGD